MSETEALAALVHDVGKYVSRVARNLPAEGPVPAALITMLTKDLYQTHQGRRASVRFDELAAALAPEVRAAVRLELAAIDALEAQVRAADPDAVRAAARHALAVDRLLREAAR